MERPRPTSLTPTLLLALLAPGCVSFAMTFGRAVPDDALLARIEPGRSTRADVLALLGPPEDYLMPLPTGRFRSDDPAERRIREERDLFGRRASTWTREVREDRLLLIVPYVMLFHWLGTTHRVDRVLVTFDEQGRVEHVGARREIDA